MLITINSHHGDVYRIASCFCIGTQKAGLEVSQDVTDKDQVENDK